MGSWAKKNLIHGRQNIACELSKKEYNEKSCGKVVSWNNCENQLYVITSSQFCENSFGYV